MECCSGYSCIIGDPSKVSVSSTTYYYGKQSHVFFKTGVSSFGMPLKVKRMNLKDKSLFCSCKSTYSASAAMAQQQTCPLSSSNSIQVIGSKYCLKYPVDLAMVKKITNTIFSDYVVSRQVDKTTKFYVTRNSNSFHKDFVLRDYADADADEPLLTIRNKIFTTEERWQVYRGSNTDNKNLLFSVKKSDSNKVDLNVYLSYNVIEDECDFKIADNWLSKNTCDVYMGDNVIAQIQKKKDVLGNRLFENDKLMLNVYPYVDYAFIVALSVIVNEMDCLEDRKTLPTILANPIKFMARLLGAGVRIMARLLGAGVSGVHIVSTIFLAFATPIIFVLAFVYLIWLLPV
ncbi:Lurp-one-related [Thalictrum thalictroides]|uniref:Lurp-one-related n=1 Tax=Thalictrum thalictroides TaxID=46969 RepID=A0A7J6V685_THATH|nr:Lurp-one-related [Thalictrum thalictroides]